MIATGLCDVGGLLGGGKGGGRVNVAPLVVCWMSGWQFAGLWSSSLTIWIVVAEALYPITLKLKVARTPLPASPVCTSLVSETPLRLPVEWLISPGEKSVLVPSLFRNGPSVTLCRSRTR